MNVSDFAQRVFRSDLFFSCPTFKRSGFTFWRWICLISFSIGLSFTAAGQVSLPYFTYFASSLGYTPGSLNGQHSWAVLQGTANITGTGAVIGDQCVVLNPDANAIAQIGIPFAAPSSLPPVMWVDCYVKPVASPSASSYIYIATSVAVLVKPSSSSSSGVIYTYDGSNWNPVAGFPINSDNSSTNWMRLTFRLDFTTMKWDLYGNGFFLAHDVPFLDDSITYVPYFVFQGDASAPSYLNYLQVNFSDPIFFNSDNTSNDVNNDGVPDDWEKKYNLYSTTINERSLDADGDGQTNLQEYINGTDPTDYYNGALPKLVPLVALSGETGPQGLVQVEALRASDDAPLVNAPVTLSVATGASQIAATPGGTLSNQVTVRTDSNGVASAYVSFASFATDVLTATAQSGTQTVTTSVDLNPPLPPSLPFVTDFETSEGYIPDSLDQQLGWSVPQGSAVVTGDNAFSGSWSAELEPNVPPTQLIQNFAPLAGQNIIFVDFYAKPVAEADITAATTFNVGSARFAFQLNGGQAILQSYNGNGSGGGTWKSTNFTAPLAASNNQTLNWIHLTARLDFTKGTWDLYANGAMAAADLGFIDSTSMAFTSFVVQGDAVTASGIDDIFAGTQNPLFADVNNDGIDDTWEANHNLSLAANDRSLIPTGNGQTVVQAYINGTDPNDYYNGVLPILTSLVNSSGVPGAQGLIQVKVTRASDGTPLANAPVTLAVTTGASLISSTPGGTGSAQVNVLTDSSGIAQAYVSFIAFTSDMLVATASTSSQSTSISINLNEPTPPTIYTTGFESSDGYAVGSLAGQEGWSVSQGSATVTNQAAFSGSQSVALQPGSTPAQIIRTFSASTGETVVYVDFEAKPVAETDVTTASIFDTGSARFAFALTRTGQGTLEAFRGNGAGSGTWVATGFTAPLATSNQTQSWVRLTARLDFTRQTWDLYANSQMVASDLPFYSSSITSLTSFTVTGDAATATALDALDIGATNPLFANLSNDGIADTWKTSHGLSLLTNDRNLDPTNNGQTAVQDYVNGTDPNDYYGGVLPTITSLVDPSGVPGPQGLVQVKVTRVSDGTVLVNAPVTLAVTTGASLISSAPGGSGSAEISVLTDSSGVAKAYVSFSVVESDVLVANAYSGSQTASLSVNLNQSTASPIYTAGFETSEGYTLGSLAGQNAWSVPQGAASVTNQDAFSGSQSVILQAGSTPAQIAKTFTPTTNEMVVYVDFYAKPVAETAISAASTFNVGGARFAFVLSATGQGTLEAFNGNGSGGGQWTSTKFTASLAANNQTQSWIELTARLDFTQQTWDLYANGVMVAADLNFFDNTITSLTSFVVTGDAATGTELDALSIGMVNPLFADLNNDGIDDAWETLYGLSLYQNDRYTDIDGNGLTILQDYLNGYDPTTDYYGRTRPVLTSLGQSGALVSVLVTDSSGNPLVNAPLTFTVATGASLISSTAGGAGSKQLYAKTNVDGVAQVYANFISSGADILTVTAQNYTQQSISININPPPSSYLYTTDFETGEGYVLGSLDQQLGWSVLQGAASIANQDEFSGFQSVSLQPGSTPAKVVHTISGGSGASVVYVDFYAKPVAETDITTATTFDTGSARFAFALSGTGQGTLEAFCGNGSGGTTWKATNFSAPLTANHQTQYWVRLTARLDFAHLTWDLYADGLMVAADLPFYNSSVTSLTSFTVTGDAATASEFDTFNVGAANPLFADANSDGIDDLWETAHGLDLTVSDRTLDPTNSGQTVVRDYINGTDPSDYYKGISPVITSLVDPSGMPGSQGLVQVKVTRASDGTPLANAPVSFYFYGTGQISATPGGAGSTPVNVLADSSGIARAYVAFTSSASGTLVAAAQSTSVFSQIQLTVTPVPSPIYSTGFESSEGYTLASLAGQNGWTVPQGAASVTSQDAFSGTRSVALQSGSTPARIARAFSAANAENVVFVDFRAKPVAETDVTTATTFDTGSARFAFALTGAGQGTLEALSGNGSGGGTWTATSFTAPLGAGNQSQNWIRLTARLDFMHQTWDLYANGTMVAADLPFYSSSVTSLTSFTVIGDATTTSEFDAFSVGMANPLFADLNNDGIDDTWETAHGLSLLIDDRSLDPTNSGLTILQDYLQGEDPNGYYGNTLPVLTSLGQSGGLVSVLVTDTSGNPLANAPLTLAVSTGASQISSTPGGTQASQVKTNTNTDGVAQVYATFVSNAADVLTASAQNASHTASISINLNPPPASYIYAADFEAAEGYTSGTLAQQSGWSVLQGTAAVSSQDAFSGAQSVVLQSGSTPAQIARTIPTVTGEDVVHVDFYAKPVAETDITAATTFNVGGASFAFLFNNGQGTLEAFNGNGSGGGQWAPTSFSVPLAANHQTLNWIRLTARLDLTHATWDLYANGLMVAADSGFRNSPGTALSSFSVQGDAATASEIDALKIGSTNPLFADVNNDGIDDGWETAYGLSLAGNDRYLDPTNNGQPVLQDYRKGTSPLDFFQGETPVLTLVSGNNQPHTTGYLAAPVVIQVKHQNGNPWPSAPVSFGVKYGEGAWASQSGGAVSNPLTVTADSNGRATAFYWIPAAAADSPHPEYGAVSAGPAKIVFFATDIVPQYDGLDTGDVQPMSREMHATETDAGFSALRLQGTTGYVWFYITPRFYNVAIDIKVYNSDGSLNHEQTGAGTYDHKTGIAWTDGGAASSVLNSTLTMHPYPLQSDSTTSYSHVRWLDGTFTFDLTETFTNPVTDADFWGWLTADIAADGTFDALSWGKSVTSTNGAASPSYGNSSLSSLIYYNDPLNVPGTTFAEWGRGQVKFVVNPSAASAVNPSVIGDSASLHQYKVRWYETLEASPSFDDEAVVHETTIPAGKTETPVFDLRNEVGTVFGDVVTLSTFMINPHILVPAPAGSSANAPAEFAGSTPVFADLSSTASEPESYYYQNVLQGSSSLQQICLQDLGAEGFLAHVACTLLPGSTAQINLWVWNPGNYSTKPGWSKVYFDGDFSNVLPSDPRLLFVEALTPGKANLRFTFTDYMTGQTFTEDQVVLAGPAPIQIQSYLNKVDASGNATPIASASPVCVGEPITLSVNLPASLAGQATYHWTVPKEAIKNYDPTAIPQETDFQKNDSDLMKSPVKFYLPIVPQDSTVSCRVTINGVVSTLSGALTVFSPSAVLTGTQKNPVTLSLDSDGIWRFHEGTNAGTPDDVGMSFAAGALSWHNISDNIVFPSGETCWNQVLNVFRKGDAYTITETDGSKINDRVSFSYINQLDNSFPYAGPYPGSTTGGNADDDSPSNALLENLPNNINTEQDVFFQASMYYMWNPDITTGNSRSIWVPLGVLTWGYKGEADYQPNSDTYTLNVVNSYPISVPVQRNPGKITGEPRWGAIFKNIDLSP